MIAAVYRSPDYITIRIGGYKYTWAMIYAILINIMEFSREYCDNTRRGHVATFSSNDCISLRNGSHITLLIN